jgi:NADPH-dependent 2,4-dienoyl-CoA reductase/sulfur reductase-like enzyme
MSRHDAIIVGGGPAGLSCARVLRERGVKDIVVLEREQEAGGVPRHCHHPGFGFSQFYWPYTGPAYAQRLRRDANGVDLRTTATVVALHPGGEIEIATPKNGLETIHGRTVLLATGIREAPRAARLVSGDRPPWGVLTTGALQQLLHMTGILPCRRPVIVGSEWVSFSALYTLRRAGIKPAAMIEEEDRITAPGPGAMIARRAFGVPVLTGTRLIAIHGDAVVEAVEIECNGQRRRIACDAVIMTGRFVPEAALLHASHLEMDEGSGGPIIDQHWRCSDPAYFAAGNVLRPIETSGVVGREGEAAGRAMAAALAGRLDAPTRRVPVTVSPPLRYVTPQIIAIPGDRPNDLLFRGRVNQPTRGTLRLLRNGDEVWRRTIHALPEQRIQLPGKHVSLDGIESLEVRLGPS